MTRPPWARRAAAGACLCLAAQVALAAPMGFKDSTMGMADLSPNWREVWVNHAFTRSDALGVGGLRMRSDDKLRTRDVVELNYTRLVHRWNLPHAQANVWFFGGLGALRGNDVAGTRTLVAPGLQLDYETTRVYTSATARLYRARGVNHDYGALRVGFAFVEADYDETQPWFIVEARSMRGLSDEVEWTPMLRFINKRFFAEVGINQARQGRFNLMIVY
ncbi:MAG: hypothetical protein AD742_19220 [Methylibium sp. NZG]|nr:MAG: hypothetical protein AD742_19220 [Methylibium sp. NZG]